MLVTLKVIFLLVLFLSLIACTPTQRPLKNGQGYVVVPAGKNHYRIEYYLKHAKLAETYWNTTAGQLCPGGFQVLYNKKHVLNFDLYVPIAGNNVNIGRQEFIQYGQVVCDGATANAVELTESKWKEFGPVARAVAPVSDRWIREALQLPVGHLTELPVRHSIAALEKAWGKPWRRDQRGDDVIGVWMKGGDSWFPNYVGVIERKGCLHLTLVFPGTSAVMMGAFDKAVSEHTNFEQLLTSGKVPAYFYRSKQVCNQ